MLAVILTKSFRCLFHSDLYIFLFFCVLELCCCWYSPRDLSYHLSAVDGAFPKVQAIHWTYANPQFVFIGFCGERSRNSSPLMQKLPRLLAPARLTERVNKRKNLGVITFLHNRKCLVMKCLGCHIVFVETTEDSTVNDIFTVDSPSFYRFCIKMLSFRS